MPKFSKRSLERLSTCHPDLRYLCEEAIKVMDITVLEGHRNAEKQNEAFATGKSKLTWPNSKHNTLPSLAVDLAPYPIDWNDRERFYALAGVMFGIASIAEIKIRWGGTWGQLYTKNTSGFYDLPHFELVL